MTAADFLAQQSKGGRKYQNEPQIHDGIAFDSKAEMRRYREILKPLQLSGRIRDLAVHPRFVIVDKSRHGRALYYEADFSYIESERLVVEDVKGVETAVFRLKARLFHERYPNLSLVIVKER